MKHLICFTLLVFSSIDIQAQWDCITTEHPRIRLNDVAYINNSTIIAVGLYVDSVVNPAIIVRTQDGGATWDTTFIVPLSNASCLHFPTEQVGYVGGSSGRIYKTTDGGDSWAGLNSSSGPYTVSDIHFTSTQVGYACTWDGPASYVSTTTGGVAWNSDSTLTGLTIGFSSSQNGYLLGSYDFLSNYGFSVTVDGGNIWNWQQTAANHFFICGDYPDDDAAYFGGMNDLAQNSVGLVAKSTDNGQTYGFWEIEEIDRVEMLSAPSINTVYISGLFNSHPPQAVIKSEDGGSSWGLQSLNNAPSGPSIEAIDCLNDSMCVAVGLRGQIFLTNNGGGTSIPTGINVISEPSVTVYPNPAADLITIDLPTDAVSTQVLVYDSKGANVLNRRVETGAKTITLDINHLPAGLYFLSLHGDDKMHTTKFIVNRH
jgi:photosystem II stability/assembly factor-like uncharacterized protein